MVGVCRRKWLMVLGLRRSRSKMVMEKRVPGKSRMGPGLVRGWLSGVGILFAQLIASPL